MCRDRAEGGRRCYHDGAEPRRNRRQNSKLTSKHMGSVITPTKPNTLQIEMHGDISISKAKNLADEYKQLLSQCVIPADETSHAHHSQPLTDKEILAEIKLIELGTVITELSYQYGAPTEEEWNDYVFSKEKSEKQYLSKVNSILNGMLKTIGARVVYGDNDVTPGKRNIEYVDSAGKSCVANESNFYMDRAVEYSQSGDIGKALSIIDAIEQRNMITKDWETSLSENAYEKLVERRSNAYREALTAVGVEFAGTDTLEYDTNNSSVKPFISKAVSMYPQQWVDKSNTIGGLSVRSRSGRAFYRHDDKLIQVDTNSHISITTHELAHRMEYTNPKIGVAERAFLNRRSGLLAYHQGEVSSLPSNANPANINEPCYYDNFSHGYMGRVYDADNTSSGTASYELLSMGMESVFYGKHGGGVGNDNTKKDTEYTNFIVGLLASTSK